MSIHQPEQMNSNATQGSVTTHVCEVWCDLVEKWKMQ